MADTDDPPYLFDIEKEYNRLHSNLMELYNLNVFSVASIREPADNLRKWRRDKIAERTNVRLTP